MSFTVSPRFAVLAVLAGSAAVAFAQTPADNCAAAPLVGPGTYSGTTLGMNRDLAGSDCVGSTSPDVWLKVTPAQNQNIVATTCGGAGWDTLLSIHSGCAGTMLACNDDSCGLQSRVTYSATAGVTYYIRIAGYASSSGAFSVTISYEEPPPPPTNGPDVTIFDLVDMGYFTSLSGTNAYAVGTNSCNVGDAPVSWYSSNNLHPVIAQNMFRLKGGRFEQIGQSWLKHGFASTNSPGCGSCQQPPDGGSQLGISCTDTYGSGLNGYQDLLGPRSEVNVATGEYPYPFGGAPVSNGLSRRLQVLQSDVNPAANPGAIYFVDCQYVTQDDAQWNNGWNNNSWRRLNTPAATGAPSFNGSTQWQQPGIHAWRAIDPTVLLTNFDYVETHTVGGNPLDINCRFIVGSKVYDNGDGTWTYEYAVQNINSHQSGGSFTIPVADAITVTNIGFHDVFYHSGEPYDNTDWTMTRTSGAVQWRSPQTHAQNVNSNALRWGTLYNFRFTANVAPADGEAVIGLFRPGTIGSVAGVVRVPTPPTGCDPDFDQNGVADQDDVAYLRNVIAGGENPTNRDPDFDCNGVGDQDDVAALINVVAGGDCPC